MFEQSVALGRWLRGARRTSRSRCSRSMFVCFILQIFFRYVLNNPVGWTEEVIVTTWLWTVLWGAAFILVEAEEIRFDIIYSHVSDTHAARLHGASPASRSSFSTASRCPPPSSYVSFMKVERSAYLHVPINWLYSVYVIFAVACIVPLLLAGLARRSRRRRRRRPIPPGSRD